MVTGLTLNPTIVAGGTSATGTVTLSAAAPVATDVALSSSNLNVAGVPASVTVAAGATSASFPVVSRWPCRPAPMSRLPPRWAG